MVRFQLCTGSTWLRVRRICPPPVHCGKLISGWEYNIIVTCQGSVVFSKTTNPGRTRQPNPLVRHISQTIRVLYFLVMEGVQIFGLVVPPLTDSRVPVDSRVLCSWKVEIHQLQDGTGESFEVDSDLRVQPGPAGPWTRESKFTTLVFSSIG